MKPVPTPSPLAGEGRDGGRSRVLPLLMVGMLLLAAPAAAENLLARATIASYPATTGGIEAVRRLCDGNLGTPWTNAPGDRGPYEFVFTWEVPVVFGGLRVAVPGGADTTSSARVLKLEIVPEGDLNWFTLKNVKLEPREGYQTFVLPALPTRKLKLTVVRNHGHPVNTYLSEIELLPPLEAGYLESLPGWVQRADGPVWLHNGMNDTVGAPRPRESLSDLFGLVTGNGGEATLVLADNPSPFGEGKGVVLQVGAFTSLLADRWYDGKPGYQFLLGSGDVTVRALAPEAMTTLFGRELAVQTVGKTTFTLVSAPYFGTRFEVKEGTATVVPYPADGAPSYQLVAGDHLVLWAAAAVDPDTVAAGDAPLLDWFGTMSVIAGRGRDLLWARQQGDDADYPIDPLRSDTVPLRLSELLRANAGGTGLSGDAAEPLARRWRRARNLADFLLSGLTPWQKWMQPDLDAARLAAALQLSGIRAGLETRPLVFPEPVRDPWPEQVVDTQPTALIGSGMLFRGGRAYSVLDRRIVGVLKSERGGDQ